MSPHPKKKSILSILTPVKATLLFVILSLTYTSEIVTSAIPTSLLGNVFIAVAATLAISLIYISFAQRDILIVFALPLIVFAGINWITDSTSSVQIDFYSIVSVGLLLDLAVALVRSNIRRDLIEQLKSIHRSIPLFVIITLFAVSGSGWVIAQSSNKYFTVLGFSLFYLPVLQIVSSYFLRIFLHNRLKRHRYPFTFRLLYRTTLAYTMFLSGCLFLVILGFFFFSLPIFGRHSDSRKYKYHWILSRFCRFLLFVICEPQKFRYLDSEDFSKPSILIANHQSFIDLLVIIGLHPNVIVLTNDWVWNSPFFGRVVQYADYYPVSNGIENSIERLKEKAEKGFSIAIFPEGTRSQDMEIKRFKKGAFYLAETLKLDILPVILHGTGDGITKGDLIIKKPKLTTTILPRITPDDMSFGESYSERSKKIRKFFKESYHQKLEELETADFFREQLMLSYAYRGYQAKREISRILKSRDFIYQLFTNLPQDSTIIHFGSEFGVLANLLQHKFKKSKIIGLEMNESKLEAANTAATVLNKTVFTNDDTLITKDLDHCVCFINRLEFDRLEPLMDLSMKNQTDGHRAEMQIVAYDVIKGTLRLSDDAPPVSSSNLSLYQYLKEQIKQPDNTGSKGFGPELSQKTHYKN